MKNNLLSVIITILFIGCSSDNFKLKPKACFDYSPTDNLKTNDTIKFSNCSLNSNYYDWDFGDGSFSHEKSPKHIFRYKQSYKVRLFIANRPLSDTLNTLESDTISRLININTAVPKADFSYLCVGGFNVSFSNTALNSTNFYWDFGDGSTSIEKDPKHFYNSKGPFTVKLKVSNEYNSDSINHSISLNDIVNLNNIQVPPFPIAPIGIDVDFDGLIDFEFTYFNYWSHTGAYESSKVIPNNNYEMFIDSIKIKTWETLMNSNDTTFSVDTFTFPRIYLFGDDISNESQIADKELIIAMFEYPSHNVFKYSSGYRLTNWIGDKIKYLGFRKVMNNKVKIGWIKLKVSSFTNVKLISFKIPEENTLLTIDK